MKIKGIENLTVSQIQNEVDGGAKFVFYTYCFSLVLATLQKKSAVYFVRENERAFVKGLPFTLTSFLFGWWGIPLASSIRSAAWFRTLAVASTSLRRFCSRFTKKPAAMFLNLKWRQRRNNDY